MTDNTLADQREKALEEAKNEIWVETCRVFGYTKDVPVEQLGFFNAGYDAGYEAEAARWHPISSEDDLPKEDGFYIWQTSPDAPRYYATPTYVAYRFMPMFEVGKQFWVKDFIAWMPIPPYIESDAEQVEGGEDV